MELGAEHATAGAFKEGGIQPLISLLWSENEAEQREVRGNMYVHVHVYIRYVDTHASVLYVSVHAHTNTHTHTLTHSHTHIYI